ncbi:MAG: Fic family protein [Fusobacterium sp.]
MKNPFIPGLLPLNLSNEILIRLYKKAIEARTKLTEFSTLLDRNLISENLMCLFSLNESVQSTKIEGTQATFDEVMESEVTKKYSLNVMEVINYMHTLDLGVNLLKTLPISTRLILRLHEEILKDGRGKDRSPGSFRQVQNWIGRNNRIEDATYIPPSPDMVEKYISNLEKYINDEIADDIDPIIKIAVIHAQFESIHPFLDGNGRLGRVLIMLYLLDKGIINKPTFFVSEELEKNKLKYYTLLNNLRTETPKWEDWISFFLQSVVNQANKNIDKLKRVETLYDEMKKFAKENNVKTEFIDTIFKNPIFSIKQVSESMNISYSASKTNINKLLLSNKIFTDDKKRNKIYTFIDLLDIIR